VEAARHERGKRVAGLPSSAVYQLHLKGIGHGARGPLAYADNWLSAARKGENHMPFQSGMHERRFAPTTDLHDLSVIRVKEISRRKTTMPGLLQVYRKRIGED